MKVWRDYEQFIDELNSKFPHERKGIRKFYDECWRVFNSLNSLELKSLEEPRYLLGRKPRHYKTNVALVPLHAYVLDYRSTEKDLRHAGASKEQSQNCKRSIDSASFHAEFVRNLIACLILTSF